MKLTDRQIEILQKGKIEDNKFYLPYGLDRKDYVECNAILEGLGLKWNKKEKAHISDELTEDDLINGLNNIYINGEVETIKDTIKKFQFYPTPKEVAEYLIELAEIKESDDILEPSAGHGHIVDILPYFLNLTLIELNKENFKVLHEKYNTFYNIDLYNGNFLEFSGKTFDKIIANPPFSNSQDVKHILHMYELLNKGGRLVSIASSSIETRTGSIYDELKSLNPRFLELPAGSFKNSGTMVNTLIVILDK